MAGQGVPKTGVSAITAAEKQRQALELRKNGATLQQIADSLGYAHTSGAQKALLTALAKLTQEPAEEVRHMEITRLDGMLFAISGQVRNGHLGAIDRALRIMERRAKLLGIDAKQESNINVTFDVRAAAERLATELNVPIDVVLSETYRMVEDGAA